MPPPFPPSWWLCPLSMSYALKLLHQLKESPLSCVSPCPLLQHYHLAWGFRAHLSDRPGATLDLVVWIASLYSQHLGVQCLIAGVWNDGMNTPWTRTQQLWDMVTFYFWGESSSWYLGGSRVNTFWMRWPHSYSCLAGKKAEASSKSMTRSHHPVGCVLDEVHLPAISAPVWILENQHSDSPLLT